MHRIPARIATLLLPAIAMLALGACDKPASEQAPAGAPAAAAPAPGLADLARPENVAKVAESTLPKGDPATSLSAYRRLDSGNQVMFMYYALAGLPLAYEDIAQAWSDEYRRTSDGFRRQDLLKGLQPRIDASVKQAAAGRYVLLEQGGSRLLERYDFAKKAFAVKEFSESGRYTYFSDNSTYTLATTNGESYASLPVPEEAAARKIEGYLSNYTNLRLQTYAFAQDADPGERRVRLQVMKVRLVGPGGEVLAEM